MMRSDACVRSPHNIYFVQNSFRLVDMMMIKAVVASMMGGRASEQRRSLADIILEKIAMKEKQSN